MYSSYFRKSNSDVVSHTTVKLLSSKDIEFIVGTVGKGSISLTIGSPTTS